jgi:hypothetical protein
MGTIIGLLLLFTLGLFILHIFICIWAYRDALTRTGRQNTALLVLIAMIFFPVIGIIVYFVIRQDLGRR